MKGEDIYIDRDTDSNLVVIDGFYESSSTSFHTSLKTKIVLRIVQTKCQVTFQLSFRHILQTVSHLNNNLTLTDEIIIEHFFIREHKIHLQVYYELGRYSR